MGDFWDFWEGIIVGILVISIIMLFVISTENKNDLAKTKVCKEKGYETHGWRDGFVCIKDNKATKFVLDCEYSPLKTKCILYDYKD